MHLPKWFNGLTDARNDGVVGWSDGQSQMGYVARDAHPEPVDSGCASTYEGCANRGQPLGRRRRSRFADLNRRWLGDLPTVSADLLHLVVSRAANG